MARPATRVRAHELAFGLKRGTPIRTLCNKPARLRESAPPFCPLGGTVNVPWTSRRHHIVSKLYDHGPALSKEARTRGCGWRLLQRSGPDRSAIFDGLKSTCNFESATCQLNSTSVSSFPIVGTP